jgi:hypothetical protein
MSFDLERFRCPWWQLKHQVQAGEAGRDEVVALLERQQAPPLELLPWLADVISGGQKFKRGVKDRPYRIRGAAARIAISGMKAEGMPIKPVRGESIIQAVAGAFNCSTRTLERWIAEEVRLEQAARERLGITQSADELLTSASEMTGIDDRIRNVQTRLQAVTGPEAQALTLEAESLIRQKIDLLNQQIESHKAAIATMTEAQRDAEAYQQRLSRMKAARDDWLRFLS